MPPLLLPRHHLRMTARQPQWRAPALKIASASRAALAPARGLVGIDDDRAQPRIVSVLPLSVADPGVLAGSRLKVTGLPEPPPLTVSAMGAFP